MTDLIDAQIAKIEERVLADDPTAVDQAARLAERYPAAPKVWCLLAFSKARMGDLAEAVRSMSRAIELSSPDPGMFFDRGRYELKQANYQRALADFDQAIAVSEKQQNEYYRESLYFLRADVLLKLGRRNDAKVDLSKVRDNFTLWTTELRTKAALLAECER